MFNYSIDTILLANFVSINAQTKKVLEVGTNNGALSIFLSQRYSKMKIDAIEIQKEPIKIALKNVKLNKLEDRINVFEYDFNKYVIDQSKKQAKKYDMIICNPPFYKVDSSNRRKGSDILYNATHETLLTLEDLIKGASKIIKQKGYLAIVEPTERLVDIFRGRIIDVTNATYIIELTGPGDKLNAFVESLGEIQIMEVVRSGVSGIARGDKALRS